MATDEITALRALAHPVRWGILLRLAAESEICACDFTDFFEVSQPTISAHLKVLREADLVTTRRDGSTICYSIVAAELARLGQQLSHMAATTASKDHAAGRQADISGATREAAT